MSAATTLGRRRLPAAVAAAIALAWAAAVAAQASGLADHFHHHALLAHGTPGLAGVGGYALLWCVMVAAMMLPSAVPLLRLFTEVSAAQAGRGRVLACFAGGYLAVWMLFGGRRWCSTTSSTA
jgi:predicted metal-binding membrane protein